MDIKTKKIKRIYKYTTEIITSYTFVILFFCTTIIILFVYLLIYIIYIFCRNLFNNTIRDQRRKFFFQILGNLRN